MKKEPSIRFTKYSEPWDEKPFGEIFVEYSDKDHEEFPPLMIVQGKGTIRRDQSERHIQYDPASLKNYKLIRSGDFIVHLRSFEGGLEKANSDGLISPAYHAFHGDEAVTSFYYPYLRSERFVNVQLHPHIYGIRDGKSIDISGMETIDIPFPSREEQEDIGSFLEHLDSLVEFHHKKFEKMSSVLLSLRDKLFAKPGTLFPENRFEDFSSSWKWVKLGDVANKVTEKNTDTAIVETFTNSAEFGVISQRRFFDHNITNVDNIGGYFIVHPQDFVYNPRISTSAPVGPINRNRLNRTGVVSPLYTVFRSLNLKPTSLSHWTSLPTWHFSSVIKNLLPVVAVEWVAMCPLISTRTLWR